MSVATQIERLQGIRDQIRNKMVSLGLSVNTDLLQDLADDLDNIVSRGDASTTLSTSVRSKTLSAGYYTGGTISVPNNYYPLTSSNTTATAGTVLKDYKFVNSSGTTVTGTIETITPANMGTSDPGNDYTNVATIGRSTLPQFIKIDKGYNNSARKFTISETPNASVSSTTTTNPTSYTNLTTVTPTKSTQYVPINAGYLGNSKVTVDAIPSKTFNIATTAWKTMTPDETGSYYCTITGVTGVNANNDIVVLATSNTSLVASCGIYASAQGSSSITFKAFNKPTASLDYKVYILN